MATFTRQQRCAELDQHNRNQTIVIERDTRTHDAPIATAPGATLAGDPHRLRGIPAIGQGVSGHIPGTRP